MVQCQQCQAENVIVLFFEIRTSILVCWNILALIQHIECTTVQSLNSQHLPCCKYSMAPCVASTTPLNTCKHAQKKVMQVNAKQDPAKCISDHLRLKCCFKSKNHLYRPQLLNQCRGLSPTQLLASILSPGLWQPGTNICRQEQSGSFIDVDGSENRGTPKSSILIGFSIINHPFWGTPIFGNTHVQVQCLG